MPSHPRRLNSLNGDRFITRNRTWQKTYTGRNVSYTVDPTFWRVCYIYRSIATWSLTLLEKLTVAQVLRNFPKYFAEDEDFIPCPLFWARSIQSIRTHLVTPRSVLLTGIWNIICMWTVELNWAWKKFASCRFCFCMSHRDIPQSGWSRSSDSRRQSPLHQSLWNVRSYLDISKVEPREFKFSALLLLPWTNNLLWWPTSPLLPFLSPP